jgi:hypothetical protein
VLARTRSMAVNNPAVRTGFERKSSIPAARQRRQSSGCEWAVRVMTGRHPRGPLPLQDRPDDLEAVQLRHVQVQEQHPAAPLTFSVRLPSLPQADDRAVLAGGVEAPAGRGEAALRHAA